MAVCRGSFLTIGGDRDIIVHTCPLESVEGRVLGPD